MKNKQAVTMLFRLPFLTVTIGAVVLGTSFAYRSSGRFSWLNFILALLGACFFHIASNTANDYFDFKSGNDAANKSGTAPFSGGSRMVLEGFVSPRKALWISLIFAGMGTAAGLYLNFTLKGNMILLIGAGGLFFIYSYNGFPVRLVNHGLGELAIFLAWGPLMVLGAYYVQTESIPSFWPLIVSIPSGILTTLVLLINEFADKEADSSTGRKTWVILLGYRKALLLYLLLALVCYAVVLTGVVMGEFPLLSLLVGVTLMFPFMAYKIGSKTLEDWGRFLPAVKTTILLNTLFLILLSVSFFI